MKNIVGDNAEYPDITKSLELLKRAEGLIPAYSQTLAKGPGQYVKGVAPVYAAKAKGTHIWDVDGNEYLDYNMGIGPLSLGYAFDVTDNAILEQLKDGITFSLPHKLELEVAELIREVVPNAESVRYSKTGADVTSVAVRLSRAFTGKNNVLCCGYHGWHDWYIAVTDRNKGIPEVAQELTYTFNYNDIQSVIDAIDDDTACVILEPFVFQNPEENFLHKLREVCDEKGVLLVFDEMWSGFRISLGGAQEFFGVRADLIAFSKAVANGMPISIITGRKDVMHLLEKDVFFFTTFGGEALSLAAAKATINFMKKNNVAKALDEKGKQLKDGYNQIAQELDMPYTKCTGYNCRTIISFDASAGNPLEMKSLVQQEMIKNGILWAGFHNISYSLTQEDIDYTLNVYRKVLPILKQAIADNNVAALLRGEPVEPVFRKTSNFNMKPKRR